MIFIVGEIDKEKYDRLIDFLYSKCDVLTFHIPNLYQQYITEKNKHCFTRDYDISEYKNQNDNIEYIQYKEKISSFLESFKPFYLMEYSDVDYHDWICSYKMEIKIVKFDKSVISTLKKAPTFYDWLSPNFPEDLCFFSGNQCYFRTISHEKISCFYCDDVDVISFIDEIGLDYYLSLNVKIPKLELE